MKPLVSIIMGSTSDLPVMEKACKFLDEMHIPFEVNALSAHRTPDAVEAFAKGAKERGIKIVSIVGPANSPLSKYLDVEILTSVFSSDYFSDISAARACELTTISILHSIIALTRTEEQMEKSHEIGLSIEKKRMPPK